MLWTIFFSEFQQLLLGNWYRTWKLNISTCPNPKYSDIIYFSHFTSKDGACVETPQTRTISPVFRCWPGYEMSLCLKFNQTWLHLTTSRQLEFLAMSCHSSFSKSDERCVWVIIGNTLVFSALHEDTVKLIPEDKIINFENIFSCGDERSPVTSTLDTTITLSLTWRLNLKTMSRSWDNSQNNRSLLVLTTEQSQVSEILPIFRVE